MTNPVPVLSDDALREIEARADAATKGPWAVWDSCSWRRIGTQEPYQDGNVVCPITQNDGHPDLLAKREDLEFIAHAREDIPVLCQTVRVLRAENERLKRGNFTVGEFQNLCHNTDIQKGFDAFADGCEAYQQKMFGKCRTKGTVL